MDADHLEAKAIEVTYQPGASSPAHSHPCPVLGYVAEGTIRSQVNDEPERVYKVGETLYGAPNGVHGVSANASQTEPAKLIAFFGTGMLDTETGEVVNLTLMHEGNELRVYSQLPRRVLASKPPDRCNGF
jgi:quercetin dioxygenase-like cupin family protein